MNPLDRPLEDVVAHTIVADLMGDDLFVLDPQDLARRAALDGFRQGITLAAKVVAEMAADHEKAGLADAYWPVKVEVLREAERQILTLPEDLP